MFWFFSDKIAKNFDIWISFSSWYRWNLLGEFWEYGILIFDLLMEHKIWVDWDSYAYPANVHGAVRKCYCLSGESRRSATEMTKRSENVSQWAGWCRCRLRGPVHAIPLFQISADLGHCCGLRHSCIRNVFFSLNLFKLLAFSRWCFEIAIKARG